MSPIHGIFISGLEKLRDYKTDEYSYLENTLEIRLSTAQRGFIDGFFSRPMLYPSGEEIDYLEAYGNGAADRRELEARHKN